MGKSRDIVRSQTPEQQELEKKKAELASLETLLAERELLLSTLRAELHSFENRYTRTVGVKYAELDSIEAEINERLYAAEPNNDELHKKAQEARSKADESARETSGASINQGASEKFAPSDNLKKLYRELAKQIHPDLTTDPEERKRCERLMADANAAYEDGDVARLQKILREWKSSPESVKGDGVGAELVRTIRKIAQVEERLVKIKKETKDLKASDIYKLYIKAQEAEKEGRDLLDEMAAHLDKDITDARTKLTALKDDAK